MRIGGLQPFTLSDFPGHVAAIVFTQGCNFRCPYCHNGPLLPHEPASGRLIPEQDALAFIQARSQMLDGVVISGGEPTIHSDLPQFLRQLKAMKLKIKLDTNGSRPDVLRTLLDERLVDFVAIDMKAPWSKYNQLAGVEVPVSAIRESIQIVVDSGIPHRFRTTVVELMMSEEDVRAIEGQIPPDSDHSFQLFNPEQTLDPRLQFFKPRNAGAGRMSQPAWQTGDPTTNR